MLGLALIVGPASPETWIPGKPRSGKRGVDECQCDSVILQRQKTEKGVSLKKYKHNSGMLEFRVCS